MNVESEMRIVIRHLCAREHAYTGRTCTIALRRLTKPSIAFQLYSVPLFTYIYGDPATEDVR